MLTHYATHVRHYNLVDEPLIATLWRAGGVECRSNRLEVLDQVPFLLVRKTKTKMSVIVFDDVLKRGKTAVVIEATLVNLLGIPQRPQRRRPVALVRRPHRLEVVDADLFGRMQVPPRFSENRWYVACGAFCLVVEEAFPLSAAAVSKLPSGGFGVGSDN